MLKWIVDGLIPEGHVVLVAGQPGNGKSWWMAQLAVDAAKGVKHLESFDTEQCSVIYIDEDSPSDVYEGRLTRLAPFVDKQVEELPIDRRPMKGFRLFDKKQREALRDDIKQLKGQAKHVLVIIDCLIKVMAGQNMDTVAKASMVMGYLTELRDAGATLVVVHHMSLKKEVKLDMWDPMTFVLGSTMIVGSSDTAFTLLQVPIREETIFVIMPQSRRLSLKANAAFAIKLFEDEEKTWAQLLTIDEIPLLPSDDAMLLFKLFPDDTTDLTVKQADNMLQEDLPKSRIRAGLAELVKERCLEKMVDPHDKSHAAWYRHHPDLRNLNSYYKRHLE